MCSARVVECRDSRPVEVVLLDGSASRLRPTFALPFLYLPALGDVLSVVGRNDDTQGSATWVIGVLLARGRSLLAFDGDWSLAARGGLRFYADGGVRLQAPVVKLVGQDLDVDAERSVQRTSSIDNVVAGTIDERAGEVARVVDGEDLMVAARHVVLALGCVKRDAGLLQLG